MKKTLTLFTLLALFIGCDNEPNKEKVSYKRVQETPTEQKTSSSNQVVINSDDQMRFDRSVSKVKSGESVTLTLNHTGKIAKEFMGHNFVLLKQTTDVADFAQRAMASKDTAYIPEGDETYA